MSEAGYRADQARRIIEDPLFKEAQSVVLEALQTEILTLPLASVERRNDAVAMYKGAQQFFRVFELVINDYRLEQSEYTQQEQAEARLRAMKERLRNV